MGGAAAHIVSVAKCSYLVAEEKSELTKLIVCYRPRRCIGIADKEGMPLKET